MFVILANNEPVVQMNNYREAMATIRQWELEDFEKGRYKKGLYSITKKTTGGRLFK